jgi:hypothetical protein
MFQQAKIALVHLFGLPKDALHIYVGMFVFLLAAILFRAPLKSWKPVAAVALAALAGEIWDVIDTVNLGARVVWWRNWHDIWNTCFWPLVLFLLARFTKVLKR